MHNICLSSVSRIEGKNNSLLDICKREGSDKHIMSSYHRIFSLVLEKNKHNNTLFMAINSGFQEQKHVIFPQIY